MSIPAVAVASADRVSLRRPPRVLLGIAGVLAIRFVAGFVAPYRTLNEAHYDNFWPRRGWLLAHLLPGTVAILLAAAASVDFA